MCPLPEPPSGSERAPLPGPGTPIPPLAPRPRPAWRRALAALLALALAALLALALAAGAAALWFFLRVVIAQGVARGHPSLRPAATGLPVPGRRARGSRAAPVRVTQGRRGRTSSATSTMRSLPTACDGDVNLCHLVLVLEALQRRGRGAGSFSAAAAGRGAPGRAGRRG
jgi:hypothetical protein